MDRQHARRRGGLALVLAGSVGVLAGCGGGGSSDPGTAPAGDGTAAASGVSGPSLTQRIAAARATAESTSNDCAPIRPFYWEIGNASTPLANGSLAAADGSVPYVRDTQMQIASASKWLYAAYVVQRQPVVGPAAVKFLTFRSGYTKFRICLAGQTVQQCDDMLANGEHDDATDGKFYYNGGHMQKHATLLGLGALDNDGLAAELRSQLGTDIELGYTQPQLAGGVVTSAANYALFLRKLMDGRLELGELLGSHAVCTNPSTCSDAAYTPVPESESWHYSLGHWVEDDPTEGDGSFSSAGAFGFYPWIDSQKRFYGIVARRTQQEGTGYESVRCGREIRRAWMSGQAQ